MLPAARGGVEGENEHARLAAVFTAPPILPVAPPTAGAAPRAVASGVRFHPDSSARLVDTGDAPVPGRQAPASGRPPVLPDGRLLRALLRGRRRRGPGPRADADVEIPGRGRHGHSHVWRAVPRRRRLHHAADPPGLQRRHLRTGGRPQDGQGPGEARGDPRGHAGHADRRGLPRRPGPGPAGRGAPAARGSTTWGVAWVELSTGDFAATEFDGEGAATLLREELGVLAPRASSCCPSDADLDALRTDGTSAARGDPAGTLAVRGRCGGARPHRAARDVGPGRLRPGRAPARGRRGRRAGAVPARHAEGRPHARPQPRVSGDPRRPDHRRDDAPSPRGAGVHGGRPAGVAARCARRHGDRDGRAPVAGLADQAARGARGDSGPARCGGGSRVPVGGARHAARHAASRCTTCSASWRARPSARPAPATWWPWRGRSRPCPGLRHTLATLQAPLLAHLSRGLDDLPDAARAHRRHARRRTADAGPRRRRDPRRRRPGGGPPPQPEPQRQERHLGDGGGRAAAHGHRLAEDPVQPRLRLLHRDLEVEPARGAGRLHPQADDCRWRALHHAGAEGVRGAGAARRRAPDRRWNSRSSRRSAARWRPTPRRSSARRWRSRRSTCWPPWPTTPRAATTASPTCTRATTSR